ncbi:Protein POLLEN DEFECTIVE IN GUIDANCE 1 [Acorus calamus]|uniref:Protein POLLEN DEFECTIVE IN GUIDANCE 1 n=1 Tax=Acorus calamus TaxID=4465 RepID=A0AAV9E4Y9_ACOCL|nr:Protein POLLEN DEFECTIVE IN GUIDANCE 1 [Acorus calamus]
MHPPMAVRSGSRKVSFDILSNDSSGDDAAAAPSVLLHRSLSDPSAINVGDEPSKPGRRRRRTSKAARKRKNSVIGVVTEAKLDWTDESDHGMSGISEDVRASETVLTPSSSCVSHVELRQRVVVNGGGFLEGISASRADREGDGATESSSGQWRPAEPNGSLARLETVGSLDWKRVMAEDCSPLGGVPFVEKYPWRYFMGELYGGNSLRSTTSVGNENKRQKVYNTMFHVPWRCELLIDVGFFVCLDSFLSLLTIMPARILMTFWRFMNVRQIPWPNAAELSDFGCFVVLACGVVILQATDISLIYHFIRGQGTVKLYVVYNVLEIMDKLCQSFGGDVLQVLFKSAEGLSSCSPENVTFELLRFIFDQTIAVIAFNILFLKS